MSDEIQVRVVNVELLRAGPAHNQLLSPLTQYLGICDDAEAGVVTQPYEHMIFLERMKAMRYEDGNGEAAKRNALRELGVDVARVLGSVPQLPGALSTDAGGPDMLVHLRLVLTPSELATLPFELAKVPVSPSACTEAWLSLQARTPVVLTRRTRNVSANGVRWPLRPRILFIAGSPDDVPFDEHRRELLNALQPFRMPGRDEPVMSDDGRREQFGQLLTILKDARFEDVVAECAAHRYTHVHLLSHGVKDPDSLHASYGLELGGQAVSAERLASAFAGLTHSGIQRPSVVTLATCDSGNQQDAVLVPGGSIAHVLHQAGIALVLASQVPLSKEGSVLVVRELYRGLLWAENPWVLMHRLRTALHGLLGDSSHDWASLVVYEALPRDLADQLEEARYLQVKAANNAAFERIDRAAVSSGRFDDEMQALNETLRRLPTEGRFAMEGLGLRASSFKRLAQAEFRIAQQPGCPDRVRRALSSAKCLHQALHYYEQAVAGFLVDDGKPVQRVASLHWVLVQQLCLSAVLGKCVPDGTRETALMSARAYLEHPSPEEQAWAHGSLAELALLALEHLSMGQGYEGEFARIRAEAMQHVRELIRLARRLNNSFLIESTLKQFRRYVDWWGTTLLENVVISLDLDDLRTCHRDDAALWQKTESAWAKNGMVGVARELADMLDEHGAADRTAKAASVRYPPTTAATTPATASHAAIPAQAATGASGKTVAAAASPVIEMPAASPQRAPANTPAASDAGAQPFLRVEMLPADHGDCLWLEFGRDNLTARVLVDGGTPEAFDRLLRPRFEVLPAQQRHLELLILTHIDADHVGGGIPLLKAAKELGLSAGDVWFNGWKHIKSFGFLGAKQGEIFSALLEQLGWTWNGWQDGKAIVLPADGGLPSVTLPSGLVLTLLSPSAEKLKALALKWKKDINALGLEPGQGDAFLGRTTVSVSEDLDELLKAPFRTDTAPNNGSSITVLAEYGGKSILLGADCHAPLLAASLKTLLRQRGLKKLPLSAFKVPHHGSRNNLDETVMALIECHNYLISTSGKLFRHPDREAIARIIRFGGPLPTLWFNYRSDVNEVWAKPELQAKYNYRAMYPAEGQEGLLVTL